MDGVTSNPRQKYAEFEFNNEPIKFECLFESVVEYEGWLEFNRLENEQYQGYDVDFMEVGNNGISD